MKKETTSEQYCQDLLGLEIKSSKAFTNTVISLSSYTSAKSVTELSESALFHHQYSSIRDGIHGVGKDAEEQSRTMHQVCKMGISQLEYSKHPDSYRDWLLLQTDASGVNKAHSRCLEDRQYIKVANNVIKSNKPISVGYPISLVNVSVPPLENKWSVPLNIRRISSEQTAVPIAIGMCSGTDTGATGTRGFRFVRTIHCQYFR